MNDLTPSFERETGQVIIEGLPAGAAGEAPLIPVPGLDLAFDRADGRLCRVVVDTAETDGPIAVGEQVAAILIQLFGAQAPSVVSDAAAEPTGTRLLSPQPRLAGTLSNLARLDAARATSPVPPGSPWWAAEAADLAGRAGLPARASAEAHSALAKLLGQLDSIDVAVLPEPAARAALAVAALTVADEPAAAARLREAIGAGPGQTPAAPPPISEFDVAAEVESLEKDRVCLAGLQWMLDPGLVPEGLFRPGLSPYSGLSVRHEGAEGQAEGQVVVEALLVPGADYGALSRCLVRLVDPTVRRVLAQAAFTKTAPGRVQAELQLPFPLDELPESWIEVVQDKLWPVRSAKGHRIQRALRWADAALRAERAPAGLAPHSAHEDWTALAATAWDRCRRDWEAVGDDHRADLAARRQAAIDPRTCAPQPPIDGPAYLAEILGRLTNTGPGNRPQCRPPGPIAKRGSASAGRLLDYHQDPPVRARGPRSDQIGGPVTHDDQRRLRNPVGLKKTGDRRRSLEGQDVVGLGRARSRREPVDHRGHPRFAQLRQQLLEDADGRRPERVAVVAEQHRRRHRIVHRALA
jgi:hypothetical protein